jgi:Kef-type K+ transport system membrane component KefB
MSSSEFGLFILTLSVFLLGVHGLGAVFARLRQPKLVGEILAGILLGPWVLKLIAPSVYGTLFSDKAGPPLGFIYNLGLILLMFCSGSETRRLLAKENRRQTYTLIGVADVANFTLVLSLGFAGLLPLAALTGPAGNLNATLLVLAIAVAVTSIPVISRIFWDLRIMHTRFVSLILGSAVLEDIVLWAVLAIATALAKAGPAATGVVGSVTEHVVATVIYMVMAMVAMPRLLRRLADSKWNLLYKESPVGYLMFILFAYCAIASYFDISLVFGAFLAGFGIVGGISGTERERYKEPLEAISKVSFAVFVPIYFGVVGWKLVFGREFSIALLVLFIVGSTVLSMITSGLAARLAGFRGLDIFNIALTVNARGGPGIVLATVAYDAGIINAAFYTTLVLAAVFTSQMAGAWLWYVLKKGLPLLSTNPTETWLPVAAPQTAQAALQPVQREVAA